MSVIYYLQHVMRYDGSIDPESGKAVGVFRTPADVAAAIGRAQPKPGFRDPRGLFLTFACRIGETYWPGGLDCQLRPLDEQSLAALSQTTPWLGEATYFLSNMSKIDTYAADYILGFYESRRAAETAAANLASDATLGGDDREFIIDRYVPGEDHWTEGFSTREEVLDELRNMK